MGESPSGQTNTPAPEVLQVQADSSQQGAEGGAPGGTPPNAKDAKKKHGSHRPSHKATFIGLAVVVAILAINGVVIWFFLRSQSKDEDANRDEVTLSAETLENLGVSRNTIGDLGVELTVGPNSDFKGDVKVGGDVNIAGQLSLNSKFTASDASLAKLAAGDTSLQQLNVNGDGTVTNFNLRKDLIVAGLSRFQGPATFSQPLTVNSNAQVAGNLAVGNAVTGRSVQAGSLIADSTLRIGGKIVTSGSTPSVAIGTGLGSAGTVSISGNEVAGTVAANAGVGAAGGLIASVTFKNAYSTTPHVVVTPIGNVGTFWISRSSTGFSIFVGGGLAPGGYAFDYVIVQ
jgi:cytoskeletal protein CcmA (bactofilin family)